MVASLSSQQKCYFLFLGEIVCNIYIPPDVTAVNSGTNLSDSIAAPTSQVRTMSILLNTVFESEVRTWFCSNHDIIPFLRISVTVCMYQACWAFYLVRETSAKFGLRAGNVKFQYTDWRISLRIIICINLSVSLSVFTSWAVKIYW